MLVYTVVHHTVTPTNVSAETIASWKYYNVVIDYEGKVYDRNKEPHFRNNGKYSYDISLVGNFENIEPSPAQLDSLYRLTDQLGHEVIGHSQIKDFGLYNPDTGIWPTACPGKNLLPLIKPNMKLIQELDRNEVYLVLDGKRYWVLDPVVLTNIQALMVDTPIEIVSDVDDYPYGAAIFLSNTDDPNQRYND